MTSSLTRYKNAAGVVIRVDDHTAATLGREWEPVAAGAASKRAAVASSEPDIPAGNASRDAWADYARHLGITVEDDAKRDEIRANVEALLGDDEG